MFKEGRQLLLTSMAWTRTLGSENSSTTARAADRLWRCDSYLGHSCKICSSVYVTAPQSRQRCVLSLPANFCRTVRCICVRWIPAPCGRWGVCVYITYAPTSASTCPTFAGGPTGRPSLWATQAAPPLPTPTGARAVWGVEGSARSRIL